MVCDVVCVCVCVCCRIRGEGGSPGLEKGDVENVGVFVVCVMGY